MRLNLNFKDSNIKRISPYEFEIVFDLSNMIKPRLSENVRMYIEHFNTAEFLDEALGLLEGDLKGYFELRCNNIAETSYDTEYGNNGTTLIFTSPLENYRTFVNNNPMYINNFKISQNFLQNRLVMNLKIFDRYGQPYDSSKHLVSEIDKNAQTYKDYIKEMNIYNDFNDELGSTNFKYKSFPVDTLKKNVDYYHNEFKILSNRVFTELRTFADDDTQELRARIIAEQLLIFLKIESFNSYKNYFEYTLSKINKQKKPFRANYDLTINFYKYWINYVNAQYIYENATIIQSQLDTSKEKVITKFTPSFTLNENVEIDDKIVNYEVEDATGTVEKEGLLHIKYFNSKLEGKYQIIINDFSETTGELKNGDVMLIDDYNFKTSLSKQFTYYFAKTQQETPKNIELSSANRKNQKFSLSVTRDSDAGHYDYEFLDNTVNILKQESRGFVASDTIKIRGSLLGGVNGTNDIVIEVLTIDDFLPDEDFAFNGFSFDETKDLGTIDFTITKPNDTVTESDEDYVLKSFDYTNSKNYRSGYKKTILGNELNGEDNTHNLKLEVTGVWDTRYYQIDKTKAKHKIRPITITQDTDDVVIKDATGKDITGSSRPSEFEIVVTSENDQYVVTIPNSKGFIAGSKVFIGGNQLTGKLGTNDLEFTFSTVDPNGKIDENTVTFTVASQVAREPKDHAGADGFDVQVIQKLRTDKYEFDVESDNENFQENDKIVIKGSDLGGGVDGDNDLIITITKVDEDGKPEEYVDEYNKSVIIDHNYGEIETIVISGKGRFIPKIGQIKTSRLHTSSQVPVDIYAQPVPTLEITLNEDPIRSKLSINTDLKAQDIVVNQKKDLVVTTTRFLTSSIGPYQEQKLKCMNMSLVLYDEVPEYTQSSTDAIKGNTYSRLSNGQFKRI